MSNTLSLAMLIGFMVLFNLLLLVVNILQSRNKYRYTKQPETWLYNFTVSQLSEKIWPQKLDPAM
jgi:hypothetical protein